MALFLKDIETVRAVDWGKAYLWDIMIPGTPAPFDSWFPATDIEIPVFNVQSFTIEGAMGSYKIPQRVGGAPTMTLTFLDSDTHTLLNYFRDWIDNDVFLDGRTVVNWAENAIRRVVVAKYDHTHSNPDIKVYYVYPEGELKWHGSSESSNEPLVVELVIMGTD